MNIKTITIIGAGNVAYHLAQALKNQNFKIEQIYNRNLANAQELAKKTDSHAIDNLNQITTNSDLYIIAVKDDAIELIIKELTLINKFVVHTAGSVEADIFSPYTNNYGVLYPLQTFTKTKKISFTDVPLCIEANTPTNIETLKNVAQKLSNTVIQINTKQRQALHLSAVFACNFTNHLLTIAYDLLDKNNINFEILKPLIEETIAKALINKPFDGQTGPAVRKDIKTIKKHMMELNSFPEYQKMYSFVSESIINLHHNNNNNGEF